MSSTTYSQELPPWTKVQDLACYDLEGAKSLKIYEEDFKACTARLEVRAEQYRNCESVVDRVTTAYLTSSKNVKSLSTALHENQLLLEETDRLLSESEAWSLKGGALPWVLLSSTGLIIAGFFVGLSI